MSLTSRLAGHTSLKEWLHIHLPVATIMSILEEHNSRMADVHAYIRPSAPIFFPRGGMAFIYAFRWWLQPVLEEWLSGTVAWSGLKSAGTEGAFIARFEEFSPLGATLLAEYDSAWRMDGSVSLLEESQWYLPLSKHGGRFAATIEDVAMLYESIAGVFQDEVFKDVAVVSNPSFSGSKLVGGADANLLLGRMLFDIRTTLKKRPADLTNLYQQIMYYLLDLNSFYGITHLGWYYSRQRAYFVYPVEMFVPHPDRTRAALVDFLTELETGLEKTDLTFGIVSR